ncbi:MAG: hypothetical protein AAFY67_02165, partial [Cyanobacteria bacterium J06642_9]
MVFQQISQAILRRYLLRYPEPVRVVRYNDLTQQAWLLPSLKAIAPEVLPNSTDAEISKAGDASRLVADAGLQPSRRYYH